MKNCRTLEQCRCYKIVLRSLGRVIKNLHLMVAEIIIITDVILIQQMHLMFPHYQVMKIFSSEF